jgi:hypothetical protein
MILRALVGVSLNGTRSEAEKLSEIDTEHDAYNA